MNHVPGAHRVATSLDARFRHRAHSKSESRSRRRAGVCGSVTVERLRSRAERDARVEYRLVLKLQRPVNGTADASRPSRAILTDINAALDHLTLQQRERRCDTLQTPRTTNAIPAPGAPSRCAEQRCDHDCHPIVVDLDANDSSGAVGADYSDRVRQQCGSRFADTDVAITSAGLIKTADHPHHRATSRPWKMCWRTIPVLPSGTSRLVHNDSATARSF